VESSRKSCTVYIVGSGPGNKGLITIMGYKVLKKAEVLIYDYLIPNEIIDIAPPDCIKIPHQKGETADQRQKKFEELCLITVRQKKL